MTERYTMRDKNGTMLMDLAGEPAENIFNSIDGEWKTYQPKGGKRTVCYEITRDGIWEVGNRTGAYRIYLWEGTKIIKD